LGTHLVYKVSDTEPPAKRTQYDGQIAFQLKFNGTIGHHERETGKEADKQEDYQRIGQGNEECRQEIMEIGTLVGRYGANGLHRIATEGIDTEEEQHDATYDLEQYLMLHQEFIHKTHTISGYQCIDDIA
jgi:hypothetical protein